MGFAVLNSSAISGSLGVFGLHSGRGVKLLALLGAVQLPDNSTEEVVDPGSGLNYVVRGKTDLIQGHFFQAQPTQSGGTTTTGVVLIPENPVVIQDLQLSGTNLTAASWVILYALL